MCAGNSTWLLQQFLSWEDSNKEPQNFSLEYISLTLEITKDKTKQPDTG